MPVRSRPASRGRASRFGGAATLGRVGAGPFANSIAIREYPPSRFAPEPDYWARKPPSIARVWPVTMADASPAR